MPAPTSRAALFLLLMAFSCCAASALGMEDFGNAPLNAANYTEWPGIMPVVNHPSRVYHWWVNGNEEFYYHGSMDALNDTLAKFAQPDPAAREIVLRPGPGETRSFDGKQVIGFGWDLHLIGGIAHHETTLDQGDQVWRKNPVLSVYVGGPIALENLRLPERVPVLSVTQVKQRVRAALKSSDPTVRGWGCGVLVSLDPYDDASRDAIAARLKDKDNWVRLNAVHSLIAFGRKALPALPALRALLDTTDAGLKTEAAKSIQAIEQAPDTCAAERLHREALVRIDRFVTGRKS